eukprot:1849669-Rhodomonas_salina.1
MTCRVAARGLCRGALRRATSGTRTGKQVDLLGGGALCDVHDQAAAELAALGRRALALGREGAGARGGRAGRDGAHRVG